MGGMGIAMKPTVQAGVDIGMKIDVAVKMRINVGMDIDIAIQVGIDISVSMCISIMIAEAADHLHKRQNHAAAQRNNKGQIVPGQQESKKGPWISRDLSGQFSLFRYAGSYSIVSESGAVLRDYSSRRGYVSIRR